jgi:hypothetical protein
MASRHAYIDQNDKGSGNNDAISWPGFYSYCTIQISRPYDLPFRVLDITNIYGSFLISVTAFGLVGYDIKFNYAENPATCVYESIDVIHNLSAEEEHRKHYDSELGEWLNMLSDEVDRMHPVDFPITRY